MFFLEADMKCFKTPNHYQNVLVQQFAFNTNIFIVFIIVFMQRFAPKFNIYLKRCSLLGIVIIYNVDRYYFPRYRMQP